MAWTTPVLVEICIGLEINGYMPSRRLRAARILTAISTCLASRIAAGTQSRIVLGLTLTACGYANRLGGRMSRGGAGTDSSATT